MKNGSSRLLGRGFLTPKIDSSLGSDSLQLITYLFYYCLRDRVRIAPTMISIQRSRLSGHQGLNNPTKVVIQQQAADRCPHCIATCMRDDQPVCGCNCVVYHDIRSSIKLSGWIDIRFVMEFGSRTGWEVTLIC